MHKKARFALPVALVTAGILIPSASSTADTNMWGTCPDGYTPTPLVGRPDDDRNGNGVICVKFVGSHENIQDDPNGTRYRCNGFPTPPPECVSDPDGSFYVLDDII
ncbi:MAG TPA: hypothetical protein VF715_08410 [Thermoleophilaceae bacterium]|jgi:hypothetical protein